MSEEKPLLARKIMINDKIEITLGRLLFTSLLTLFQILGIMAMNGWTFSPEIFILLSNLIFSLRVKSS